MPLESYNSEYTRNGDYTPTRFQAQAQAVASVFTAKTDSNPESSVGLLSMAGKAPALLVTPTNDIGKLLSALSRAQIGGSADLTTAVQIAQLALKHRENKNARQRVVVFAGSHIDESEEDLVKLGKKLRKNNVLIDVCLFGEEGMEGEEKVGKLIEAAGGAGGGDCHLVVIPPGPHLLSDLIQTSPILYDGAAIPQGDAAGEGGGDMMGIDPNMDPELAMAIRMSLQDAAEQAAREAAAAAPAAPTSTAPAASADSSSSAATAGATLPSTMTQPLTNPLDSQPSAPGDAPTSSLPASSAPTAASAVPATSEPTATAAGGEDAEMDDEEDEDEMLKRAMAMSQAGGDVEMGQEDDEEEDEDEDAAMARAIAMSLEDGKGEGGEKK